ncbi:MAG: hypothetical protein ACE5GZ_02335 [Gammaproteobacteria bacterium]
MTWGQWHKWHRILGVVSALFIVLLSVTGMLLNHTEQMNLRGRYVQNEALLDWYDIREQLPSTAYTIGAIWIVRIGERIYFNNRVLDERGHALHGAVSIDDRIVAAVDDRILLISKKGELIERLTTAEGTPAGIERLGVTVDGKLAIRTSYGDYLADLDNLEWQANNNATARWATTTKMPDALHSQLLQLYRGRGLPWEHIILDIHSGRILGQWGEYCMDFFALLFLFLALSGTWMWLRHMWR